MKYKWTFVLPMVFLAMSSPSRAGLFSSCETKNGAPKPEWVSKLDYSLPNYYAGVGVADRAGKNAEEQRKASENDAKSHLAEQIEVTIRAENQSSKQVTNNKDVQEFASANISVTAQEVLHDLKIKDRWMDGEACTLYTLMVVDRNSVALTKREKLMKTRLEKMKKEFAEGTDRDKIRSASIRHQHLEEAKLLFNSIDFSLIEDEYGKDAFAKKLADALLLVQKEMAETQGQMAVYALNRDARITPDVVEQMLDELRASNNKINRLSSNCVSDTECINKAKEQGFSLLALLVVDARVETSNVGALKGTLTLSKTVYDISSKNIVGGPKAASAQIIGWGNDELDWSAAAKRAVQEIK